MIGCVPQITFKMLRKRKCATSRILVIDKEQRCFRWFFFTSLSVVASLHGAAVDALACVAASPLLTLPTFKLDFNLFGLFFALVQSSADRRQAVYYWSWFRDSKVLIRPSGFS